MNKRKYMSKSLMSQYYDEYSCWYDEERMYGYYSLINELEFDKIRRFAIGKKTLEIGCGTGLILERVNEIADVAYGVDISGGMLDICRGKGLDVFEGSVVDLPFKSNSFDVVYSFKVLPHVQDIQKAMSEILRVAKPGGRMVLEFYNSLSFKGLNDWIRKIIYRRRPVYVRYMPFYNVNDVILPGMRLVSTRGIRIFGPLAACYTLPIISSVVKFLDRRMCDGIFRIFGGYFVIEVVADNTDNIRET
jgi:ubiquinone/menaquinone biosynthesis C-methylase UbiE